MRPPTHTPTPTHPFTHPNRPRGSRPQQTAPPLVSGAPPAWCAQRRSGAHVAGAPPPCTTAWIAEGAEECSAGTGSTGSSRPRLPPRNPAAARRSPAAALLRRSPLGAPAAATRQPLRGALSGAPARGVQLRAALGARRRRRRPRWALASPQTPLFNIAWVCVCGGGGGGHTPISCSHLAGWAQQRPRGTSGWVGEGKGRPLPGGGGGLTDAQRVAAPGKQRLGGDHHRRALAHLSLVHARPPAAAEAEPWFPSACGGDAGLCCSLRSGHQAGGGCCTALCSQPPPCPTPDQSGASAAAGAGLCGTRRALGPTAVVGGGQRGRGGWAHEGRGGGQAWPPEPPLASPPGMQKQHLLALCHPLHAPSRNTCAGR